jgi:hypothetical protein
MPWDFHESIYIDTVYFTSRELGKPTHLNFYCCGVPIFNTFRYLYGLMNKIMSNIDCVLSRTSCVVVSCLTTNEKAVLKSRESRRQKGLVKKQEQRNNKRRMVTWGYHTAE